MDSNTRKPYVYVTPGGPRDGGDFGPLTPGTKTGGIQEALDYAHANCRDVYIWGGRGGLHDGTGVQDNVYVLHETLRIPWSQDFKLDGGNYLMAYQGKRGHAVQIDSQMNCRYKFGLITSGAPEAVVCLKPQTQGPDDFVVITASVFDFSAVCAHHPEGIGIQIDASEGLIINSKLFAEETNTLGTGVYVTDNGGTGYWISNNTIQVMYGNQYHAVSHCTGLRLGDPGSRKILHNRLDMTFHAPRGAYFDHNKKAYVTRHDFVPDTAIGADIHAQRNTMTFAFYGKRAPGHDIVFEPDACDNTVYVMNLPNGITNRATMPTNKVQPRWPVGFDLQTPPVPASGESLVNTSCYTVQILITAPGDVKEWTLMDAGATAQAVPHNLSLVDNLVRPPRPSPPRRRPFAQTFSSGFVTGQSLILEPGDSLRLIYSEAPAWRWRSLR